MGVSVVVGSVVVYSVSVGSVGLSVGVDSVDVSVVVGSESV